MKVYFCLGISRSNNYWLMDHLFDFGMDANWCSITDILTISLHRQWGGSSGSLIFNCKANPPLMNNLKLFGYQSYDSFTYMLPKLK